MLRALLERVADARSQPWRLQRTAWAASGAMSLDPGTSLADLVALAGTELTATTVLPASPPVEGALLRLPTAGTAAAVAAAGLACHP